MPLCEKHGQYYRDGQWCSRCGIIAYNEAKRRNKEEKQYIKELEKKKPSKIKRLTDTGQKLLSSWFKKVHCKGKFTNCSICNKPVLSKGTHIMNTIHTSHYFPKGIYWMFMFEEINLTPCCYNCNVNNPQTAPGMRNWLVSKHGEDKIKDLELRAEQFIIKVKTNQLKSKPDELYLMSQIQELKRKSN